GGKNSLNRLIRCVCGKKIGPDPRNFNQRVSLGRNDLLIRTFLNKCDTGGREMRRMQRHNNLCTKRPILRNTPRYASRHPAIFYSKTPDGAGG
ncbi:hypothetical protein ACTM7U_16350, partial [Citrobacter braakii]